MLHTWFYYIILCDNMLHNYAYKVKKNSSQHQWLKGFCEVVLFSRCQTSEGYKGVSVLINKLLNWLFENVNRLSMELSALQ